jgi:hypothetical protein
LCLDFEKARRLKGTGDRWEGGKEKMEGEKGIGEDKREGLTLSGQKSC